jgi:hypothetical protein
MSTPTEGMIASLQKLMNQMSLIMSEKSNFIGECGYDEDAENALQMAYIQALKVSGELIKSRVRPTSEAEMKEMIQKAFMTMSDANKLIEGYVVV